MSDYDTTTELNPGSGGSLMDESAVTQDDGTEAHRPRVVLGHDDGRIARPGLDGAAVRDEEVFRELQQQTLLLREIRDLLLELVSS